MKRGTVIGVFVGCFVLATTAHSDTGSHLRPGLWRVTLSGPRMSNRVASYGLCMDRATERALVASTSPRDRENCSRYDTNFTPTGAVVDTVCVLEGVTYTSHRVVTYVGDTAYAEKTHFQRTQPNGPPIEDSLLMQAKWESPCPVSMKPGDKSQMSVTTAPNRTQ